MARPPTPIDRCELDAVLELCRTETEDDCDYFYDYEVDAEGRLKNLFWADIDSRIDFTREVHGNVVVFDTTCRTNKHGVAFVPFVGLSRHRTPVVLGCGVTTDQSLDSLVWLLRAFMDSNTQKRPASVITDSSDAVATAVKTVFPGANHRFCSGHVEQGIEEHLRGSPVAQTEFRALMRDHKCSPAVFLDRWNGFMAMHRTAANQRWLDAMYRKRKMWAAAFVHGKFFLGMANDQRTECLATALHTGLREDMSLRDLWRHADTCAHALRRDVAALDHRSAMSQLALTTEHRSLEEHAARLFTPANFYLVREEIRMLGRFHVVIVSKIPDAKSGDLIHMYTMYFNQCRDVSFRVTRSGNVLKCSCRKMEREGLPCRHIFCMMRYTSMEEIPDCCALRRMRRMKALERQLIDAKMEKLEQMKDLGRQVFDVASEDAQDFQEIKGFFETWLEEKERRRGSRAVAVEDNDDAVDVESSMPLAKRIKLFDD